MNDMPDTTIATFFRDDPYGVVDTVRNSSGMRTDYADVAMNMKGEIVVTGGDREMFAVVYQIGEGNYGICITDDPMDLIDVEELNQREPYSSHSTILEAFQAACEEVGYELPMSAPPSPAA